MRSPRSRSRGCAGCSAEEIQKGLETFRGIKRRMEVRGIERGVTVIDDFAHHPTAIATTLNGARKRYPGAPLGAVRAALDLVGPQGIRERATWTRSTRPTA